MLHQDKEKITKLIFTADSIKTSKGWSLADKDNPLLCDYCKSPIFYIRVIWGVIDETAIFEDIKIKVIGKEKEPQYSLREIGFVLYCAECGHFHEHFDKYFYPEDKQICSWDDEELDYAEKEEIWYCLQQFNQKGEFTPRYESTQMHYLKEKLKDYELKISKIKTSNKKSNYLSRKR